jgi:hypothetical protein
MLYTDFYSEFNQNISSNDLHAANITLMKELGNILVRNKKDFVDLLNESGIDASLNDSNVNLVNLFINNIDTNRKLILGSSMLIAMHNKQMGFDGEDELSDQGVKNSYKVIKEYFIDDYSNVVAAIAGAVGALANVGSTAMQGQQKKKYGGLDLVAKKEASKQAMIQSILDQKKLQAETVRKQQEEKAKTQKLVYIIGGSVLAIGILGFVIYMVKKK